MVTAKAAQEYSIIMVVSTCSACSFEEIKALTSVSPWFQLYIHKDRGITKNLIQLAKTSGYVGIVLTVDAPINGKRAKETNHLITLSPGFEIKNLQNAGLNLKYTLANELIGYLSSLLDPIISWNDIVRHGSTTSFPIIFKGIMNPKDIQIAIEYDIDVVIISNHGGKRLDTALSSVDALKLVRNSSDGNTEVIHDGGASERTSIFL